MYIIYECFKGAHTTKVNFCINVLGGIAIIFYRTQVAISFVLLVFYLCQFLLIMKTEFGRVQDFTCYTVSTDFQWFILYAPVASNIVSEFAVSFFSYLFCSLTFFTEYISSAAVQNKHFFYTRIHKVRGRTKKCRALRCNTVYFLDRVLSRSGHLNSLKLLKATSR